MRSLCCCDRISSFSASIMYCLLFPSFTRLVGLPSTMSVRTLSIFLTGPTCLYMVSRRSKNQSAKRPTCARPAMVWCAPPAPSPASVAIGCIAAFIICDAPRTTPVEIAIVKNNPPAMERERMNRMKQNIPNISDSNIAIIAARYPEWNAPPASAMGSSRADHNKNAAMMPKITNSQKCMRPINEPFFFIFNCSISHCEQEESFGFCMG